MEGNYREEMMDMKDGGANNDVGLVRDERVLSTRYQNGRDASDGWWERERKRKKEKGKGQPDME